MSTKNISIKSVKILGISIISICLLLSLSFGIKAWADNGKVYKGKDIGKDKREYVYKADPNVSTLEEICLDKSCKFENEFRVSGKQNDGEYWFGDGDLDDYKLKNLKMCLINDVDTPGDREDSALEINYKPDTPSHDWDGEDFTFFWTFKYGSTPNCLTKSIDNVKIGDFTDRNDTFCNTETVHIPDWVTNEVRSVTGYNDLIEAMFNGKLEIQLTRMVLDPH